MNDEQNMANRLRNFADICDVSDAANHLMHSAADLIERQAKEIAEVVREREEWNGKHQEACLEIERQTNEIGRLREALESIVTYGKKFSAVPIALARAALNEHQEQPSDDPTKS